jgi:hypothetical protein
MGRIKNFYHEEINSKDRFEDSEHFNNYSQLKTANPENNGKEKQGDKAHQNDKQRHLR